MNNIVILQSNDGYRYGVTFKAVRQSKTISDLLDACDVGVRSEERNEMPVIPLPNLDHFILERVLIWLMHHADDPPYFRDRPKSVPGPMNADDVPEWDQDFFAVKRDLLFELVRAANYLNIPAMFHQSCKIVYKKIHRSIPQLMPDFEHEDERPSDEEEEEVRPGKRRRIDYQTSQPSTSQAAGPSS